MEKYSILNDENEIKPNVKTEETDFLMDDKQNDIGSNQSANKLKNHSDLLVGIDENKGNVNVNSNADSMDDNIESGPFRAFRGPRRKN